MLQENKLRYWLEEALFAIDRFPEASNIFHIVSKLEKVSKFAMFCSMGMDIQMCPAGRPAMQHDVLVCSVV